MNTSTEFTEMKKKSQTTCSLYRFGNLSWRVEYTEWTVPIVGTESCGDLFLKALLDVNISFLEAGPIAPGRQGGLEMIPENFPL